MAHIYSDPVHTINADIIRIEGHKTDGDTIDFITGGEHLRFNQDVITTGNIRSDKYARQNGEVWALPGANSVEITKPVNFGDNALTGVAGLTLPATQITSANYANQNLDFELDALTTAQNTILARTQGLTANKIMASNSAGLLAVSSINTSDIHTLAGNQTVSGNKTHSGDITISDLTASKLVLTDANKKLVSASVTESDLFKVTQDTNTQNGTGSASAVQTRAAMILIKIARSD